jgi:hypothetical protein
MAFPRDTSLVDRVLSAPQSEWYDRKGYPILIFLVHMAEGGGTDTWLTRPDGNSSHYVIKYSGELVQMVPEAWAAGSVNPRMVRTSDDAPYTYMGETVVYGGTALSRSRSRSRALRPRVRTRPRSKRCGRFGRTSSAAGRVSPRSVIATPRAIRPAPGS